MVTKESVVDSINDFKNLVSEIDEHVDDNKFFYKLCKRAKCIAHDIESIDFAYFVAFAEYGRYDNFVRVYYPLGFMTAERARKILDEKTIADYSESRNEGGIKEVSEEEYHKYFDLIEIQKLYDSLHNSQYMLRDILPKDFIKEVEKKVDALRDELGLRHHWEHVASRY